MIAPPPVIRPRDHFWGPPVLTRDTPGKAWILSPFILALQTPPPVPEAGEPATPVPYSIFTHPYALSLFFQRSKNPHRASHY